MTSYKGGNVQDKQELLKRKRIDKDAEFFAKKGTFPPQNKRVNSRPICYVDVDNGVVTTLKAEALAKAIKDGSLITRELFRQRQLVDSKTGIPSQLQDDALAAAKANGDVMPRWKYYESILVDAKTGKPSELDESELKLAQERQEVVIRRLYNQRQRRLQKKMMDVSSFDKAMQQMKEAPKTKVKPRPSSFVWVDSESGLATDLIGDTLQQAIADKTVITGKAFVQRQYNRTLVDIRTGTPTSLDGAALEKALHAGEVIAKSAYLQRKPVDVQTGKFITLPNEELEEAKKNGVVMSSVCYRRQQRNLKIQGSVGMSDSPAELSHKTVPAMARFSTSPYRLFQQAPAVGLGLTPTPENDRETNGCSFH